MRNFYIIAISFVFIIVPFFVLASSIVINEVMYSPTSEPEWIELYNATADSADVKVWK